MENRTFIFDMDGTVVDNMAFHTASWLRFFERRGIAIDADDFFHRTAGRIGREIMREFIGSHLSDAECDLLNAEKETIYRSLYAPYRRPMPGFEELIADARREGIKLAIATSAPPENVAFILDKLGLRERFDAIVAAGDVGRGKPHPDVFLKAAEQCRTAPADCVVFEDAPLGVEAAARAGMAAFVLTTTMQQSEFTRFTNLIGAAEDYRKLGVEEILSRKTAGRNSPGFLQSSMV